MDTAAFSFRRLAPDGNDLVRAVRKFANAAEGRTAVIDADGRHTSEEVAWAVELSDGLMVAGRR